MAGNTRKNKTLEKKNFSQSDRKKENSDVVYNCKKKKKKLKTKQKENTMPEGKKMR